MSRCLELLRQVRIGDLRFLDAKRLSDGSLRIVALRKGVRVVLNLSEKATQFDFNEQTTPPATNDTPVFNLDDFTDYVAFHRKCDLIEHGSKSSPIKMSQKKCRFCD